MKAIVQDAYGSPDVLELRDIDKPVVKDDEVFVRVHAAAVHPGDLLIMRGLPYILRLMGFGLSRPKKRVPGFAMAGHVEMVGKNVTQFQAGDEVFGVCKGALVEYVSVSEDKLGLKPGNITFEQAAAVPISGLVALRALRDHGKVQPGQKVLINGASGGIGTFAVQIAKSLGAEVTGVCSTRNVDMVRSLGADHVVDYTQEDFTQSGQRYDFILDNVANHSLADCRRALTPNGTLIPNNGTAGGRWTGTLGRTIAALAMSPVPAAEGAPVRIEGTQRGPCCSEGTDRSRQGHTGHRQDLPLEGRRRRHAALGRGTRSRKGRRHGVTGPAGTVYSGRVSVASARAEGILGESCRRTPVIA